MPKHAKNMHKYAKYESMKIICIICTGSHFADEILPVSDVRAAAARRPETSKSSHSLCAGRQRLAGDHWPGAVTSTVVIALECQWSGPGAE